MDQGVRRDPSPYARGSAHRSAGPRAGPRDLLLQGQTMHTIRNANGMILRAIDLGARIVELHAPDRDGVCPGARPSAPLESRDEPGRHDDADL